MSLRWLRPRGRLRKARDPRGLTSIIRHGRLTGNMSAFFAMKANLICLAPQRTGWPFLERPSPPRSIRFSFRNSAISRSRPDRAAGFYRLRRFGRVQRPSVEKPIPKSAATCLRGKPLPKAARTASARNSSVGRDAICVLLCYTIRGQRSGTIPRQVQTITARLFGDWLARYSAVHSGWRLGCRG